VSQPQRYLSGRQCSTAGVGWFRGARSQGEGDAGGVGEWQVSFTFDGDWRTCSGATAMQRCSIVFRRSGGPWVTSRRVRQRVDASGVGRTSLAKSGGRRSNAGPPVTDIAVMACRAGYLSAPYPVVGSEAVVG